MPKTERNILDEALHTCKNAFWFMAVFSFATNILMLVLPIFSLQVLDRVISSGSMETLIMLGLVSVGLFLFLGAFQAIRSLGLIKIGEWFDGSLAPALLNGTIASAALRPGISGSQSLRDLNTLKSFVAGQGMIALFDAPFSIVFVIVIFFIHPIPGFIALGGGGDFILFCPTQ